MAQGQGLDGAGEDVVNAMTKHKEPSDVAVLAARIMFAAARNRVGRDLQAPFSPYYAASLAERLCAIERAQRRHAERQCGGAPDHPGDRFAGYVRLRPRTAHVVGPNGPILESQDPRAPKGMTWEHDPEQEERAGERIAKRVEQWKNDLGMPCEIELAGDPRGAVLKLRLPGEAELTYV